MRTSRHFHTWSNPGRAAERCRGIRRVTDDRIAGTTPLAKHRRVDVFDESGHWLGTIVDPGHAIQLRANGATFYLRRECGLA